ncbi:MAG: enoyl-CoA hydratase/isomerase family protein [Gemmatimonadetes bacterium]|nr:enoyl-CoA hydratase/isomerase family protein [Gemmatimonadota bacterium]
MSAGAGPEHVRIERRGRVAWVILDRAERLNAFDEPMSLQLCPALREALADPDSSVLVITGAGRAFCAGADIAYLRELHERGDGRRLGELVAAGGDAALLLRGSPKPVLAAVNGPAAGGGANLALACDVRIAARTASIGQTFVRIGLHPDWGGTHLLPRIVGTARALELMWSGRMVDASEALALGLFDRVVPADELEGEVTRLAEHLAAAAPDAVGRMKAAVYAGERAAFEEALRLELANQLALFEGGDAAEGLRAFLAKRAPRFSGQAAQAAAGLPA